MVLNFELTIYKAIFAIMHNNKRLYFHSSYALTKLEKAVALLFKRFTRNNYAIGFTFQSASKDFIN